LLLASGDKSLYEINGYTFRDEDEIKKILLNSMDELNKLSLLSMQELSPNLNLNNPIIFNDRKIKNFIYSGFSGIENWGSWTDGNKAVLLFKTDNKIIEKAEYIEVSFNVFSNGKYVQKVEFNLNGINLSSDSYNKNTNYILKIPIDGKLKPENELDILVPNAISPSELKINSDTRKLGIGMIYIKLY
jgi:hypothetical protein